MKNQYKVPHLNLPAGPQPFGGPKVNVLLPPYPTAEDGKDTQMGTELGEGMEKGIALGVCKHTVSWAEAWQHQAEVTSQV